MGDDRGSVIYAKCGSDQTDEAFFFVGPYSGVKATRDKWYVITTENRQGPYRGFPITATELIAPPPWSKQ